MELGEEIPLRKSLVTSAIMNPTSTIVYWDMEAIKQGELGGDRNFRLVLFWMPHSERLNFWSRKNKTKEYMYVFTMWGMCLCEGTKHMNKNKYRTECIKLNHCFWGGVVLNWSLEREFQEKFINFKWCEK